MFNKEYFKNLICERVSKGFKEIQSQSAISQKNLDVIIIFSVHVLHSYALSLWSDAKQEGPEPLQVDFVTSFTIELQKTFHGKSEEVNDFEAEVKTNLPSCKSCK